MRTKDLAPNPKNPRKISDAKLEQLKKAMLKFGDLSGIIYNRQTKQLVGGHQRMKILPSDAKVTIVRSFEPPTKTGTVAVGYVKLDGERFSYREVQWSRHDEMAANIAANKGAGEWDMPELTEWLKELASFDADDFDMSLTMFDEDELDPFGVVEVAAYTRTGPAGVDEDEVPAKPPSRIQPGDIYELGDHRLMCGDSTSADAVEKLMAGQKADMVFTDPPYGVSYQSNMRTKSEKFDVIENDDSILSEWINVLPAVSKGWVFIWTTWKVLDKWLPVTERIGKMSNVVIWDKGGGGIGDLAHTFITDYEIALVFNRSAKITGKRLGSVWSIGKDAASSYVHPTQKPVELAVTAIENCTNAEAVVLDLFGGSGSTLIACEKIGRKCFMMEFDLRYCDVIVERWEKYTGQKAKLLNPPKKKPITKLRKKPAEQGTSRAEANA